MSCYGIAERAGFRGHRFLALTDALSGFDLCREIDVNLELGLGAARPNQHAAAALELEGAQAVDLAEACL